MLLRFGVILLSYSSVPWHLVGFSLVCFLEIALPDALWVARVFKQFSSGDDMWLFPILVWLIAGQYDVVFEHDGFSHRHVGVSYALRVSPAVTRLTVYRRPQVDDLFSRRMISFQGGADPLPGRLVENN